MPNKLSIFFSILFFVFSVKTADAVATFMHNGNDYEVFTLTASSGVVGSLGDGTTLSLTGGTSVGVAPSITWSMIVGSSGTGELLGFNANTTQTVTLEFSRSVNNVVLLLSGDAFDAFTGLQEGTLSNISLFDSGGTPVALSSLSANVLFNEGDTGDTATIGADSIQGPGVGQDHVAVAVELIGATSFSQISFDTAGPLPTGPDNFGINFGVVVPEPSSVIMLFSPLAFLLFLRRRERCPA